MLRFPSNHSRALVRMQVGQKTRKWLKDEKRFALLLYYNSPSAYKHLLRQRIILPSIATIKSWIGKSKFKPGINSTYFEHIKKKVETTIEEKKCVVCFDEMALKQNLEYSKPLDLIEGFEDFGPLGRTASTAKEALVFMARGLYSTWKMPLAYFVAKSATPHSKLVQLLLLVLENIMAVGLLPILVVCDGGSNNRSAMKSLGVTSKNPFFIYNNEKIFHIYDVPHLSKSLRNNLLNGYFLFQGKKIDFNDIRKTYDIDRKSSGGCALTKLTYAHMNPNPFQKLSVNMIFRLKI